MTDDPAVANLVALLSSRALCCRQCWSLVRLPVRALGSQLLGLLLHAGDNDTQEFARVPGVQLLQNVQDGEARSSVIVAGVCEKQQVDQNRQQLHRQVYIFNQGQMLEARKRNAMNESRRVWGAVFQAQETITRQWRTFALDANEEQVQELGALVNGGCGDRWKDGLLDVLWPCVLGGVMRPSGFGGLHQCLKVNLCLNLFGREGGRE